ncbi:MAG: very short patch repair endonuclease [Dissulfurispiraceae bacterium]
MVDRLTPEQRHRCMSRIRAKNTGPEIIVRKIVYGLGYRFRIHRKDLPGKPDLVFPRLRKVIFVHGCFWHMHNCTDLPKTNAEFWVKKLRRNVERDKKNRTDLRKLDWKVLVIWECQMHDQDKLKNTLLRFLDR